MMWRDDDLENALSGGDAATTWIDLDRATKSQGSGLEDRLDDMMRVGPISEMDMKIA
jgi:hypothetical protein